MPTALLTAAIWLIGILVVSAKYNWSPTQIGPVSTLTVKCCSPVVGHWGGGIALNGVDRPLGTVFKITRETRTAICIVDGRRPEECYNKVDLLKYTKRGRGPVLDYTNTLGEPAIAFWIAGYPIVSWILASLLIGIARANPLAALAVALVGAVVVGILAKKGGTPKTQGLVVTNQVSNTVLTASSVSGWRHYVPKSRFDPGDQVWLYAEALDVNRNGRASVTFNFKVWKPGEAVALINRTEKYSRRTRDTSCWAETHFLVPQNAPPGKWSVRADIRNNLTGQFATTRTTFTVLAASSTPAPAVSQIVHPESYANQSPVITAVSAIHSMPRQILTISGRGFGNQRAYDGNSHYILVTDLTGGWNAGNANGNDLVTLSVASWTDSQITIQGFTGAYGRGWSLNPGDQVRIRVWNAQTGAGPATIDTRVFVNTAPTVATGRNFNLNPVITSVSAIGPVARQTININGSGFGSQEAYSGNSPYILITDVTRGWNAGYSKGYDLVQLNVSGWTDSQITIQGFTGAYGRGWSLNPGDQVQIRVWNAQTGAGPATIDTRVFVNTAPINPSTAQVSSRPNLVGQWRWTSGRGRFRYVMYITSQTQDGQFRGYLSGGNGIISGKVEGNDVEFTRVLTRFGNKEQTYTGQLIGSRPYLKIVHGLWSGAFEENGEGLDWHAELIP